MTNFFEQNPQGFHEAADYINQRCISFAGRSIRASHTPWVFGCLARAFARCDDATAALNFDCVASDGRKCIVSVATDGSVTIQ